MDQVKVSLFKDGPDRVQIVIDGNNISDYLSIIADSIKDTILLKNADAKPIAFNKYENVPFFKGTEYEGKTPSELLSILGDKGLGILKKYGVHASEQQKSEIEICIKNFLSDRFKSVDPEIFAGKLNEHQLQVFFDNYGKYILTDTNINEICQQGGYESFDSFRENGSTDEKRDVVIQCINKAKKSSN